MLKKKSLKSRKDWPEKQPVIEGAGIRSSPMKDSSEPSKDSSPSEKKKRAKDEIDEIFASKKRKKSDQGEEKQNAGEGSVKTNKAKKKKEDKGRIGRGDEHDRPSHRHRRKTNDGLTMYSEEELGINKA